MKKLLLTTVLALSLGATTTVAQSLLSLDLSNDISDSNIVYPESFETDTHQMLENWYVQQYTSADALTAGKTRSVAMPSDEEIIARLGALPFTIEMPYNSIVRSYIQMYVDRKRTLVETMLGLGHYYMPIFEQALDRHGLPLELKYLVVIESALNPNAVSRAGATGLWQFMLPTAKGLGLEINTIVDERRDPYAASDAAARYLKQLYNMYEDWSLAIAAYNCGPGNVNKALRRAPNATGKANKDFWQIYYNLPKETRGYVPGFIAAAYVMNYYNRHGIQPVLAKKPLVTDTIQVNKRVNFKQISDVMSIPMDELRTLNPQYRADVIPGDIRPYTLVLPSLQTYCYIANEDSIINYQADLYARREVVEPSDGDAVAHTGDGVYVTQDVTKWHKVRRGETLKTIARKYGVTQSSIQRANKMGKSTKVNRGQNLKIVTQVRKWVPAPSDSINAKADTTSFAPKPQEAYSEKPAPKADAPAEPKFKSYTVKAGDNLFKIASANGVTVDDIKQANGLTNDNIQLGQKLKIPEKQVAPQPTTTKKATTTKKKSTSKKKKATRRRRR